MRPRRKPSARPSVQTAGVLVPRHEEGAGFSQNAFSFSSSRTRRRRAVISASISCGSGRPCSAAWRLSRSSLTHRPTTDSPSPKSRATDAIEDPVSNTRHATSRRYSGVKRRRVPITGTSLSAGTHTRFTKCQQHQPKPNPQSPASTRPPTPTCEELEILTSAASTFDLDPACRPSIRSCSTPP